MADNRESTWTDDENLKEVLTKYVQQGLQRSEALDFLRREFPEYAWSIRSLDRRLRHFNIFYNDRSIEVQDVKEAVDEELKGPGKLLGYRALRKKIRSEHGLNVTWDQVYDVMSELDHKVSRPVVTSEPRDKERKETSWHVGLTGFTHSMVMTR